MPALDLDTTTVTPIVTPTPVEATRASEDTVRVVRYLEPEQLEPMLGPDDD